MTITTLTSREFNRDCGRAKRAADEGPRFVTDRERPAFVLVTFDDWLRLSGGVRSIAKALSGSIETAEIDFESTLDCA